MSAKKKSAAPKVSDERPAPAQAAPVTAKQVIPHQPIKDFFDHLGNKAPLVVLGLLVLICVVVFNNYLFGGKPYFFIDIASDSYNLSYPNMVNYADYIAKHGIPKWSFNYGMGQNIFPFFLRDPFDLILYMAGKNSIDGLIIYVEVIKIVLSGLVFFMFLRKVGISVYTSTIGSISFAFCGFMIMGSAWYGFTYEALCMALLLWSFELLYQDRNWYMFPIVICIIALSMPFNVYVYGIILAIYALFRHLNEGAFDIKKIGGVYLQMLGLGIVGLLISGPFLLENILQLIESPRVSGTNSLTGLLSKAPMFNTTDKQELGTSIMRFFSNDILGSADGFRGWKNIMEAGSFYCGLPCLLLMPQVFVFLSKKGCIIFASFLALWLIPMFFPYFRYAFWLFSGDYYRAYAFAVALLLIIYSVYALDHIIRRGKVNLLVLGISLVGLLAMANYPFFDDPDAVNGTVRGFAEILLLVYAGILFMIGRPNSAPYLRYVLMGLLVFELCYMSGTTANGWITLDITEKGQKIGYRDNAADAVKYIQERDKSFFRIDKSFGSSGARFMSINDGLAQGYHGSSAYNPFNQLFYIGYLQLSGVSDKNDENASRWAAGFLSKPLLESVNQVKYMLAKERRNPIWQVMCDSVAKFGDVVVFRNKFWVPFGFTYNQYIKESVYTKLSAEQKSFLALKACVVKDEETALAKGLKEFNIADTAIPFNLDIYRADVDRLAKDTMVMAKFEDNNLKGTITVPEARMVYMSIPYDKGWSLTVDGQPREKIVLSAGMTGVHLDPGTHTIEMTYQLRTISKGVMMMIAGLILYALMVAGWIILQKKKAQTTAS